MLLERGLCKVEDLKLIDTNGKGKWAVFSNGKQLTNVIFN